MCDWILTCFLIRVFHSFILCLQYFVLSLFVRVFFFFRWLVGRSVGQSHWFKLWWWRKEKYINEKWRTKRAAEVNMLLRTHENQKAQMEMKTIGKRKNLGSTRYMSLNFSGKEYEKTTTKLPPNTNECNHR